MQFLQESPKTQSFPGLKTLFLISASVSIIYLIISLVLVPNSKVLHFSVSLQDISSPTSLDHIVFGIASNNNSWPKRKDYVRLWWRPKHMRGCVFLDNPLSETSDEDQDSLPSICISEDTSRFQYTYRGGLRSAIRVARVVLETVALNYTNVRWFVFGDDDTVFFTENLVRVLSKYDHKLWYYIGSNSESFPQNKFFSFEMAYGGAGFAISYPLAKVFAKVFDSCIERYPYLYGSDGRIFSCLAELGIPLTREPGFHQLDLRGDMYGLLAAHPLSPLVSLHHLDLVDPIFPNKTSIKALEHLYEAGRYDPHRIVQQAVCYDKWFSWTVSVSWGYAVQVFPRYVPVAYALRAQHTFMPFRKGAIFAELYDFDTREHHWDPCRRPPVFFMDSVSSNKDGITSIYKKIIPLNCTIGMDSPLKLEEIRVYSHKLDLNVKQLLAPRRQCCDVLPSTRGKVMEVAIRNCQEEEMNYI